MVLSILSILVILAMGYVWLTRGFFSALIHLACTLVAGAIAFAAWEPVAYFLIGIGGGKGYLPGVAWSLALALPFAAALALLRLAVDSALRANVIVNNLGNYIGGGACGAASGLITAGILALSLGFLRMETGFLGATHAGYDAKGNIVRQGGLMVPADKIVAGLYGAMSERSLATGNPLARWHPDVHEEAAALRINYGEGAARNTTAPDDFEVVGRFTVGRGLNLPPAALLGDRWNPEAVQSVSTYDGGTPAPGSHIEGFLINFKASAKEKEGKVTVGAGQVRLVCENPADETRITVYPVAVNSQADSANPRFARWRYDAKDTYIASVGGAAEALFGFEFVVPPGFEPIGLYIKNSRHVVGEGATAQPKYQFATTDERDAVIETLGGGTQTTRTGALPGAATTAPAVASNVDTTLATVITVQVIPGGGTTAPEGLKVSNVLPFVIQKGTEGSLEVDGDNRIVAGQATYNLDVKINKALEKPLRIQNFLTTSDTRLVQLDVSLPTKTSLLGKAAAGAESVVTPVLMDSAGGLYQPVGYIYEDETKIVVRFDPGDPIRALSQIPSLSRSRPAQKLTLLFRVSFGVQLKHFALSSKVIATFDPPFPIDQPAPR